MEWNLKPCCPEHRRLTECSLSKDVDTPNYGLPLLRHDSEPFVDETHQIKPLRQNNQAIETHQIRPTSPPCLMTSPTKSDP